MRIRVSRPHAEVRREAYPPVGDALDAVARGFDALRDQGMSLPPETVAWLDACRAVKDRHPKGGRK